MLAFVIDDSQPRMRAIRLRDVCFFFELPVLLGTSVDYVRKCIDPPNSVNGDWYRAHLFPRPFYVSPSGIRCWWRKDVESWALTIRAKRTGARKGRGIPLLDSPELVDELLGL